MKPVVYTDPLVPAEWIAAHRLRPSRILPAAVEGESSAGVCPYALAVGRRARERDAAAVIFTTACDQMRRIPELAADSNVCPWFVMNVPSTWQTAVARDLYLEELERLGRFLVRLGGKAPSADDLWRTMDRFDGRRSKLREARAKMSPREYSEALCRFRRNGKLELGSTNRREGGTRVALLGGPLMAGDFEVFEVIERAGGNVVLDATATGERTLPAPFDRREDDPCAALMKAYLETIPDAFRRPNGRLYDWLNERFFKREVEGLIVRNYTWCDTWHAEVGRLKEWTDVPVLHLSADGADGLGHHEISRIEAFLEIFDD